MQYTLLNLAKSLAITYIYIVKHYFHNREILLTEKATNVTEINEASI